MVEQLPCILELDQVSRNLKGLLNRPGVQLSPEAFFNFKLLKLFFYEYCFVIILIQFIIREEFK